MKDLFIPFLYDTPRLSIARGRTKADTFKGQLIFSETFGLRGLRVSPSKKSSSQAFLLLDFAKNLIVLSIIDFLSFA